MLLRHLRKHHREEYSNVLDAEVQKRKKSKLADDQPKISGFVTYFPTFQKAYINWMVQTHQPISCCENSAFRAMCQSLNIKAPILGREKVRCLLTKEVLELRADVTTALKGMYFSATTDAWTANNNINYSTCTVHFIDRKTWILHHFALGIFKKTGAFKAEDVVAYCQNIWKWLIWTTSFVQPSSQIQRLQCARQGVFLSALQFKLAAIRNGMATWITFSSSSQKSQ
jgi:hypothetical protein